MRTIKELYINELMQSELAKCGSIDLTEYQKEIILKYSNIIENNGSFVVDENNTGGHKMKVEFIKKIFGNFTGLETSNNKFHVKNLFSDDELSLQQELSLGEKLLQSWEEVLSDKFEEKQFVLMMSLDNNNIVIVRFYQYRADEGYWIEPEHVSDFENALIMKVI